MTATIMVTVTTNTTSKREEEEGRERRIRNIKKDKTKGVPLTLPRKFEKQA
jgi:hypothetical protein